MPAGQITPLSRTHPRARAALGSLFLIVGLALPASAYPSGLSDRPAADEAGRPDLAAALELAETGAGPRIAAATRLREVARSGQMAALLGAATTTPVHEVLQIFPEGAAVRGALTGRLSAEVVEAIGDLVDATVAAEATVRDALSPRVSAEASRLLNDLSTGRLQRDMVASDGSIHSLARLESLARRVRVDDMKIASVAILRAVDRLRAAAASAPEPVAPTEVAAQCDVFELPSVVCIAGEGANEHLADYNVTVDLGGDDIYRNNEGAGTCLNPLAQLCTQPVSVAVDLAGKDRYEPRPLPASGVESDQRTRFQQGAGFSGIGILVDGAGDDTYTTVGPVEPCPPTDLCSISMVQGTGNLGVGVLSDLGGNDSYRALAPTIETDRLLQEYVYAQGVAIAGAGVLWDAGVGDDIFEIKGSATGTMAFVERRNGADVFSGAGPSSYSGQGSDMGGTALLLDGGGNDRFSVIATPPPDAATSSRAPQGVGGAVVNNWVQGFSVGNASFSGAPREDRSGALVTGVGDTEYVVDISARFLTDMTGQGYGRRGFIDDAGGDDLYSMRSSVTGEWRASCDCEAATIDIVGNTIAGANFLDSQRLTGQAAEIGLLHDRGGNDRYVAEIDGDFTLSARNHNPAGKAEISAWLFGVGSACAQACEGMLLDDDGDDQYGMHADHTVRAERDVAGSPGNGPGSASVFLGSSELRGQAASFEGSPPPSVLVDRGGLDRYEATRRAEVLGVDATRSDPGESRVSVQGGYLGTLVDLDDGEEDLFYAETPTAVDPCVGVHGQEPGWVSRQFDFKGNPAGGDASTCRPAPGGAIMDSTASAATASLTVLDVTPAAGPGPAVVARARLVDGSGAPIAGRPVVFVRQARVSAAADARWMNDPQGWAIAITDANGVASATVSLASSPAGAAAQGTRIRALFFGTPGAHRPAAHAS